MRGAILGSQGVSFVLQVRRFPNGEKNVPGQGSRPDLALLPPIRQRLPLWLQDVTSAETLSPVGMGEKQKRENKQAQNHAQGNCFLSCVLDKSVLTFAGCAKVPRPPALAASYVHFSGFQTEGTWKLR